MFLGELGLRKVVYDRESQTALLGEIVKDLPLEPPTLNASGGLRTTAAVMAIRDLLYILKNPAFAEEQEWRLLHVSKEFIIGARADSNAQSWSKGVKFRSTETRIVPYREWDIPQSPEVVGRIVLGPRNDTPLHILSAALVELGFKDIKLLKSNASFR
jgi:hypothetical protein